MNKCFAGGILFLVCLLSTSCVTLVGKKNMNISIYTKSPAEVIYNSDTLRTQQIEEFHTVKLRVPRSKDSLRFTIKDDSITKDISIKSGLSGLYYANLAYPPFWPGLGIDLLSSKRFGYKNTLLFNDSLNLFSATNRNADAIQRLKTNFLKEKYQTGSRKGRTGKFPQQGDFYFNLSIPFIYPGYTILKLSPGSLKDKGSALGFAGGLDYYYRSNRFFNLSASATFGGDITIGCGDDGYDDTERFNVYHITASHNHRFKRFSFGYGISHAYTDWWAEKYYPADSPLKNNNVNGETKMRHDNELKYATLGLVFNGYTYFSDSFSFGIIYKPTFVRLNSIMERRFCYEHQISFDLAIKIKLNKRK